MDARTGWLFAGLVLGTALAGLTFCGPLSIRFAALQAKADCEATLPRNQECKIIAVPKEKRDEAWTPFHEPPGGDDEHR